MNDININNLPEKNNIDDDDIILKADNTDVSGTDINTNTRLYTIKNEIKDSLDNQFDSLTSITKNKLLKAVYTFEEFSVFNEDTVFNIDISDFLLNFPTNNKFIIDCKVHAELYSYGLKTNNIKILDTEIYVYNNNVVGYLKPSNTITRGHNTNVIYINDVEESITTIAPGSGYIYIEWLYYKFVGNLDTLLTFKQLEINKKIINNIINFKFEAMTSNIAESILYKIKITLKSI